MERASDKKRERGAPPIPTRLPASLVVDRGPYGVCGVTATAGAAAGALPTGASAVLATPAGAVPTDAGDATGVETGEVATGVTTSCAVMDP